MLFDDEVGNTGYRTRTEKDHLPVMIGGARPFTGGAWDMRQGGHVDEERARPHPAGGHQVPKPPDLLVRSLLQPVLQRGGHLAGPAHPRGCRPPRGGLTHLDGPIDDLPVQPSYHRLAVGVTDVGVGVVEQENS